MGEWRFVDLAEVADDIAYGYTESASDEQVGPKFLRITDIANGPVNWAQVPYCPINEQDLAKYRLLPGDIVIARTGASTGANYTMRPSDPEDVVFASYLIRYRINEEKALPAYVGYCLRSPQWKSYVGGVSGGSAQPGANAKVLGAFEFELPELPEQRAIASVLSSLDAKIDLLHRQNKTLEAMAETLFRQWFVEEAEEGWEEVLLGDLIEVRYGKDHKALGEGDVPVYGSGGVMRYADRSLFEGESILIPRKGSLNNVMYVNEAFWTVDTMFFTEMKRPNIAKFIYHFVKQHDLASMNVGSAVPSMTTAVLNNMPLQIPGLDVFTKYETTVGPLYTKHATNIRQIKSLTALRDTLLPKLMSGEVRVEATMEQVGV